MQCVTCRKDTIENKKTFLLKKIGGLKPKYPLDKTCYSIIKITVKTK